MDITLDASNLAVLDGAAGARVVSAAKASSVGGTGIESTATTGNVAWTASAGSLVGTAAQQVVLAPTGDFLATATGNAVTTAVDITMDASNLAVMDGAAGVRVVSAANVETTTGSALVETVGSVKRTVAASGIQAIATTGNISLATVADSVQVVSSRNIQQVASGDLLAEASGNASTAAVDITLDASNLAVMDGAAGVRVVSAANVETTAGGSLVETVGADKATVAATGIQATATAGNVAWAASAGSLVGTAAKQVSFAPQGNFLVTAVGNASVTAHDSTVTASNVAAMSGAVVGVTGVSGNVTVQASAASVVLDAATTLSASATDAIIEATDSFQLTASDATVDVSNVAIIDAAQGVSVVASTAGNVDISSAAAGFHLTASTAGTVKASTVLVESATTDIQLNAAGNLTTVTQNFVGTHASGLHLTASAGAMQFTTTDDIVQLNPGSSQVGMLASDVLLQESQANVVATQADLLLTTESAGKHIFLEPTVSTSTTMPVQFTSNAITSHVEATAGPLRLSGGDTNKTVQVLGDLQVVGTVDYITANATTLLVEDKQIILNQSDVSTDETANEAGLVVNGAKFDDDPSTISLLWNKTDSANSGPNDVGSFWQLKGGDFSVSRVIPQLAWTSPFDSDETAGYQTTDQVVEFRFVITGDEKLQVQKVRGRKAVGSNMASTGADKVVVAEFDLVV